MPAAGPVRVISKGVAATSATRSTGASVGGRLFEIEGLRAYLAFWVVIGHVLWIGGFQKNDLSGIPLLMRSPELAVDVFIIVSGFVIFLALDSKKDGYLPFVVRRFFRLFPSYILLFFLSIPISALSLWNATHASRYLAPAEVHYDQMLTWWQNLQWHVPLHLLMLHGAVPEHVLSDAPNAFLLPAWSISLEWQFYLIAPLAFICISSAGWLRRSMFIAICMLMWLVDYSDVSGAESPAALPFNFGLFLLGGTSYFVYKHRSHFGHPNTGLVLAWGAAASIYLVRSLLPIHLIPTFLWLVFLGLILEPASSPARRLLSPLFANRAAVYLGRISYGVYLSHILVVSCVQYALLNLAPELGQNNHLAILLASTIAITIPLSIGLNRYVENAGIDLGRDVANRLSERPDRLGPPRKAAVTAFRLGRTPDFPMSAGRPHE